jgi:hypothetical protein
MNLKWRRIDLPHGEGLWELFADRGNCPRKAELFDDGVGVIWIEKSSTWITVKFIPGLTVEEKKTVLALEYRLQ